MEKETDLRRGRHAVFNLHVHLVFVAKYRRKVFTKEILDDMRGIFESVCTDFEAKLVEFDGEDDHVHLLVNYPSIRQKLWGGALWSPSYFAGSCGGTPITIIRQYIEQQKTPD
ncbi:IS200/IS605 family transposase [[Pasteurella] aerogenes]